MAVLMEVANIFKLNSYWSEDSEKKNFPQAAGTHNKGFSKGDEDDNFSLVSS
jgi:hypothetical protein